MVHQTPKQRVQGSRGKGARTAVKSPSPQHARRKSLTRQSKGSCPSGDAWETLLSQIQPELLEWTRLSESEIAEIAIIAGWQPGFNLAVGIDDYEQQSDSDYEICTWNLWCVNFNTGERAGPPVEFFVKFALKKGRAIDLF